MRIIRRYSNRKLYDTKESRYATLQQVGDVIRGGDDVQVVDYATGQNLTTAVLAMIVLDQERRAPVLTADGLMRMIRDPKAL